MAKRRAKRKHRHPQPRQPVAKSASTTVNDPPHQKRWWTRFRISALTAGLAAIAAVATNLTGVWTFADTTRTRITEHFAEDPVSVQVDYWTRYNSFGGDAIVLPGTPKIDLTLYRDVDTAITGTRNDATGQHQHDGYAYTGGYALRLATISLHVTSQKHDPVDITNIRAVQIQQAPPIDGTVLTVFPQGNGQHADLSIDLDNQGTALGAHRVEYHSTAPTFTYTSTDLGPYPGRDHSDIVLDEGENATITFDITALKTSASFLVEVDSTIKGKPQKPIILDNAGVAGHGQPFRITGTCTRSGIPVHYKAGVAWGGSDTPTDANGNVTMSQAELDGSENFTGTGPMSPLVPRSCTVS
jgi:hypothetical protein